MAEVTFGAPENSAPAPIIEVSASVVHEAAVAPAAPAIGVPAVTGASSGALTTPAFGVIGDSIPDFKDIIMPRINIVQGSGMLKDSFPQGAIVHGQSLVLFRAPTIDPKTQQVKDPGTVPVKMIVLGFKPIRFVEKIAGGERGLLVNTEAEVVEAGGTLDYNEWVAKKDSGMRRFEELAEAIVLIERPEFCADDDTVFIYDVDGKKRALAMWGMKGSAYTAAYKRVFATNRKMGYLRAGYPTVNFNVSTRPEKKNGNTYFVPVCLPGEKTSPAMLDFIKGVLSPQ